MIYFVTIGSQTFEVEVGPDGVRVDRDPVRVELDRLGGTPVRNLSLQGSNYRVLARSLGSGAWEVEVGTKRFRAEVVDERTRAIRELVGPTGAGKGPSPVVAPMPGLVSQVQVAEGDPVEQGQAVVILEAMKMENQLRAEARGTVSKVHVQPGAAVEKGQLLVELGPREDEGD